MHGLISPEGEYVTYFQDNQGNEIERLVRVPFHGDAPEDLTPDLSPYSTFDYAFSPSGKVFGILLAKEGLFHLYYINLGSGGAIGAPRLVHQSVQALLGLSLSFGGEIVVTASTERREQLHTSLTAYDAIAGNRIATLQGGAKNTLRGWLSPRFQAIFVYWPRRRDPGSSDRCSGIPVPKSAGIWNSMRSMERCFLRRGLPTDDACSSCR
ncbi:MAG: hypothetical protein MPW17_22785 (plasmid) [Candidatus Manganitrophus sp.]|nr:MAG: hypothetical protein MPW17_22785 [Candidatus Manganitrophus sp.]